MMMKTKNRLMTKWIFGILAAVIVCGFIGVALSIGATERNLMEMMEAVYQPMQVATYSAEVRQWNEADAQTIIVNKDSITEAEPEATHVHNEECEDLGHSDYDGPASVVYTNDDGEAVSIIGDSIEYTSPALNEYWMPILWYVPDEYMYFDTDERQPEILARDNSWFANAKLEELINNLKVDLGDPLFVADINAEALETTIKSLSTDGLEVTDDVDGFVYADYPIMIGDLPVFTDLREAPPSWASVVLGNDDVLLFTISAHYTSPQRLNDFSETLSPQRIIGTMHGLTKLGLRNAASVRVHYIAIPDVENDAGYILTPCWSFYAEDGSLLQDINAIDGSAL